MHELLDNGKALCSKEGRGAVGLRTGSWNDPCLTLHLMDTTMINVPKVLLSHLQ